MMRILTLMVPVLLVVFGCGPTQIPTYPVSGRVEFSDGEPVRTGTVELESVEHGTTATGSIRENGTFVLGTYESDDGAIAGRHRTIVVQIVIDDGITRHVSDHGRPVPPKFSDYSTSGISVQVDAIPDNNIVITIPTEE